MQLLPGFVQTLTASANAIARRDAGLSVFNDSLAGDDYLAFTLTY